MHKECHICGGNYMVQNHHIFGGTANRKLSEKYGLKVPLCWYHHHDSKTGVHFSKGLAERLHQEGQRTFEETHTREEFKEIFKKNYL